MNDKPVERRFSWTEFAAMSPAGGIAHGRVGLRWIGQSSSGPRWIGLALILSLLLTGVATAEIWYVNSEAGRDSNNGRLPEGVTLGNGPFRTIGRALEVANIGDTIVLAATSTPYRESLTFSGRRHSGFSDRPFRLVGNGAVLDGTQDILPEQWQLVSSEIFRFRPTDGAFQQLFLGDKPATYQAVDRETLDQLQPLHWTLLQGRVYFRTADGHLPQAYPLRYASHQTGITLYAVQFLNIENLIVQGFWLDGVNAHDNVWDTKLVGVTLRGNGRSGLSVGGCSRLDVVSSLIGDNWRHQVRTETLGRLRLLGSNVLPNGTHEAIFQDGGQVVEEQPVVYTPVRQRLRFDLPAWHGPGLESPFRQATPDRPAEDSGPRRSARLPDTQILVR